MHRLVSVDLILWSVQKYSRILFGLGNDWEMTQFRERVYIIVTWHRDHCMRWSLLGSLAQLTTIQLHQHPQILI